VPEERAAEYPPCNSTEVIPAVKRKRDVSPHGQTLHKPSDQVGKKAKSDQEEVWVCHSNRLTPLVGLRRYGPKITARFPERSSAAICCTDD